MPSNTAFLLAEIPTGGLTGSYNTLESSMASYDQASGSLNLGISGISPRMFMSNINNLRALGIEVDTNNRVLGALQKLIIINYSALMLNSAYRTAVKAHAARETAMAAAETAAILGTPIIGWSQIWRIPIALGAAAMVTAAFETGQKFGSGEWNFKGGDISASQDRRHMEGEIQSAIRSGMGFKKGYETYGLHERITRDTFAYLWTRSGGKIGHRSLPSVCWT
jgi:hypothetical protein